jgi:hypothetical protein
MEFNYLRSEDEAFESMLYPFDYGGPDSPNRRIAAMHVLRRLPEKVFSALDDKIDEFHWFIPHPEDRGSLWPFFITHDPVDSEELSQRRRGYSRVLYLSPALEDDELQIAVFVVVHELAHIYLDHELLFLRLEDDKRQEKEANELVKEWGFVEEHGAFFRLMKGGIGE